MNRKHLDFIDAFNEVKVPPTIVLQDAIDVASLECRYFEDIQSSLQLSRRALNTFFEYETRLLIPSHREKALIRGESGIMTDDYMRLFRQTGRQALASVALIRNDFNYSIVHFAKYPLTEGTVESIQRIRSFDA